MTLLKGSSSRDARAQTWPDINQQMRFAAMANESNANRNRLFEIVRDGSYAEAKKVLSEADMTWQHTALRQNNRLRLLLGPFPLRKTAPSCVCPGAATRSRFAQWEWAQEESEPVIERSEDNVLVENQQSLSREVSADIKF